MTREIYRKNLLVESVYKLGNIHRSRRRTTPGSRESGGEILCAGPAGSETPPTWNKHSHNQRTIKYYNDSSCIFMTTSNHWATYIAWTSHTNRDFKSCITKFLGGLQCGKGLPCTLPNYQDQSSNGSHELQVF